MKNSRALVTVILLVGLAGLSPAGSPAAQDKPAEKAGKAEKKASEKK